MNNDPIYADQNFAAIAQKGEGDDIEDQGNGDAGDYGVSPNIPVESDFGHDEESKANKEIKAQDKKPIGPPNFIPGRTDTS